MLWKAKIAEFFSWKLLAVVLMRYFIWLASIWCSAKGLCEGSDWTKIWVEVKRIVSFIISVKHIFVFIVVNHVTYLVFCPPFQNDNFLLLKQDWWKDKSIECCGLHLVLMFYILAHWARHGVKPSLERTHAG